MVDVLMANERILAVGKDLAPNLPDLQTVEAGGMIMTPGFFDQHIHVTGGGGEGGPATRTPELVLSELVACGTTDVVGVSGTDYTTRSIPNLLAKVRASRPKASPPGCTRPTTAARRRFSPIPSATTSSSFPRSSA
ncbi:MAG: hypothetical protein ACLUNV_11835 [Sutterella wadsworthensis]